MTIPRPIVPKPRTAALLERLGDEPLGHHRLRLVRHPLDEEGVDAPLGLLREDDLDEVRLLDLQPLGPADTFSPSCIDLRASIGPGISRPLVALRIPAFAISATASIWEKSWTGRFRSAVPAMISSRKAFAAASRSPPAGISRSTIPSS